MKISGQLIKSWVYQKTLFFLVKIKGQNVPMLVSSRDMNSFELRKDGSLSGEISYQKFKLSRGSSKQYFGEQAARATAQAPFEPDPQGVPGFFDEYDPFNEDSYLQSPEEEVVLVGDEPLGAPPPLEGGVEIPEVPSELIVIYHPPAPPPPIPTPPHHGGIYEEGE